MPMNRVRFQPGLSMPDFMQRYGTEEQCAAALQAARWPTGFACPACGSGARTSFLRGGLRYWECGSCGHQCSLRSGTIFASSKLPLSHWFLAMQLLTQAKNNVSALENKLPIVAAVQTTADGHPVLACLRQQPHTSEEVAVFAAQHIATSATVVSGGLWCFRATQIVGAEHERVVAGSGKASVRLPQFRAVNTLLGNLKTAISGTYHAFHFAKYAHRYLAEFQYRFNRRFDLRSIFAKLLHALVLMPPCDERWLRAAEIHR